MDMDGLDSTALEQVAVYFRALAEPSRLRLLNELRGGERNVTELTRALGTSQANVSKHLAVLLQAGVVERSMRGTSAFYRIADPNTYKLCELVCGQLGRRFEAESVLRREFIASIGGPRRRR